MSGARLLTSFGNSTVQFNQLLELSLKNDSIMFKRDVIGLDCQDDNAVYRVFCLKNLEQILDEEKNLPFEQRGLFVYLFIMGKRYLIFIN